MNFDQWAQKHATTFGLHSVEEVKMILSWESIFRLCGYSLDDLFEATTWLASGNAPKFRTEHLQAIHDRIKSLRLVRSQQAPTGIDDPRGVCVLCNSTGSVIVPHPVVWKQSDPSFWRTCSVWCRCGLGHYKAMRMREYELNDKSESKLAKCIVDLESYENEFPQWKQLMDQHAEYIRERDHVERKARSLDQILGRIGMKPSNN